MPNNIAAPQTLARLKPYIEIYSGGTVAPTDLKQIPAATNVGTSAIATVNKLSFEVQRDLGKWRQFDQGRMGRPVEVVPGLPSYLIKMEKVVLYNSPSAAAGSKEPDNILSLFKLTDNSFKGFDIMDQIKPLEIKVKLYSPTTSAGAVVSGYTPHVVLTFSGFWFEGLPEMEFEAVEGGKEQLVIQACNGEAASMSVAVSS